MTKQCSRCNKDLHGLIICSSKGMTTGYYEAKAWQKYCNPGEILVCDSCMWKDPRYIAVYGHHS